MVWLALTLVRSTQAIAPASDVSFANGCALLQHSAHAL